MGNILLKERKQITSQKLHLEKPKSLHEYYNALPFQLIQFFEGMIEILLKRLHDQANKKQKKKESSNPKSLNIEKIQKTVIFLTSIIVSFAFKGTKI